MFGVEVEPVSPRKRNGNCTSQNNILQFHNFIYLYSLYLLLLFQSTAVLSTDYHIIKYVKKSTRPSDCLSLVLVFRDETGREFVVWQQEHWQEVSRDVWICRRRKHQQIASHWTDQVSSHRPCHHSQPCHRFWSGQEYRKKKQQNGPMDQRSNTQQETTRQVTCACVWAVTPLPRITLHAGHLKHFLTLKKMTQTAFIIHSNESQSKLPLKSNV